MFNITRYIKPKTSNIAQSERDYHYVLGQFTIAHQRSQYSPRIILINNDGTFDNSFNLDPILTGGYAGTARISPVDGKIVIFGGRTGGLTRFNTDFTFDSSLVIGTGFNSGTQDMIIQSDNKIVVGGQFTSYNGTARNRIIRLNSDGSVDTSFVVGTGFDGQVQSIALQPDGKIVVGGQFTSYNGTARNRIIRLNSDGSEDTSFVIGTGFNLTVLGLTLQPDGKIIVCGQFTSYNGTSRNYIIRLNADGSEDTSFVIGTGFDSLLTSSTIQPDGKIIVCGNFTSYNGTSRNKIIRLNSDGTVDSTFNAGLSSGSSIIAYAILQSNGKILITGGFLSFSYSFNASKIARLNSDGSLDTLFKNGLIPRGFAGTQGPRMLLLNDERILIYDSSFNLYNPKFKSFTTRNQIIKYDKDGNVTYDNFLGFPSFSPALPTEIGRQSDGKLIIGGSFTQYDSAVRNYLIRLNIDGSLDTSFNSSNTGFDSTVSSIAIQSDDKILVGGGFSLYNGISRSRFARLNSDGSLDTSFVIGTGFNGSVVTAALQTDGKILIGGAFTTYNGSTSNRIIRLNSDGSLDTSFVIGTGFDNGTVEVIILQSDGKILVGGTFTSYNGVTRNRLVRLNSDGSEDTSFVIGSGFDNTVTSIAKTSSGKILVGGQFTLYKGVTRNRIIRLNSDGSEDTSFVIGTGFNSLVSSISVQFNGKILVGGAFTLYNGIGKSRIARLNVDGSIDNSYLGIVNNQVFSILILNQ